MSWAEAPPEFHYDPDYAEYPMNVEIPPFAPLMEGGPVVTWRITPSLTDSTGLTFDTTTGIISGTATRAQTSTLYIVTGTGPGGVFTSYLEITVIPDPPSFWYGEVSGQEFRFYVGVPIDTVIPTLYAGGGPADSWEVFDPLPDGIHFDTRTGRVYGTPRVTAPLDTFLVMASNTGGNSFSELRFSVEALPPVIAYPESLSLVLGAAMAPVMPTVAIPEALAYTISPDLSALTGLDFNAGSGRISGTPTQALEFTEFHVIALGQGGADTVSFRLGVYLQPSFEYAIPAPYRVGTPIDTLKPVHYGGRVWRWSVDPPFPLGTGLHLDTLTGELTGTPAATLPMSVFTVYGTGPGGTTSGGLQLQILPVAPRIAYPAAPVYQVGIAADTLAPISTGGPVERWSIKPVLPAGVEFDTTTGRIAGTPTDTASPRDYQVRAENSGGIDSATIRLGVLPAIPVIAYGGPYTFVAGVGLDTLSPLSTGGPVVTYALLGGAVLPAGYSLNASTGQITGTPGVPVVGSTQMVGVVAVNSGGQDTAFLHITIHGLPAIATQPHDTTVVAGSAVGFSVSATGQGTLSYQWRKDGADVPFGGISSAYSLASSSLADTGNYTVLVISTLNGTTTSVTSGTARLFINAAPTIITQPKDTTALSGVSASFTTVAVVNNGSSAGTFSYQWRKNGANVATGGTSTTYTIAEATIADTGSYTVVVTRTLNGTTTSMTSGVGRLSVNAAPEITLHPRDTTVVAGVAGTFRVSVLSVGGGTVAYQWKKGGLEIPGATSATYSTAPATLADTGSYTVTVSSILNGTITSTTSAVTKLFVNAAPVLIQQPNAVTVASGEPATFTVAPSAAGGSSTGTLSYQWRRNGVDLASTGKAQTFTLAAASIADTGHYTVMVTRTLNGTITSTLSTAAKLSVNASPIISLQPHDTTVVLGAPVSFAIAASAPGALSYQWMRNGTEIPGAVNAAYLLAAATLADTGIYAVTVASTLDGTMTQTLSLTGRIFVNMAPTIAAGPKDTTVLTGAAASFTVTAAADNGSSVGAFSYQWRKNGVNVTTGGTSSTFSIAAAAVADTGSYTVVVTRTLNGTTTSTISGAGRLSVNAAPEITTQPRDTTVVAGIPGTFRVSALVMGGGSIAYQWKKNGLENPGATSATYTTGASTLADTGSYSVTVNSTLNGTTTSATSNAARLFVNIAPTLAAQPKDTTVISGAAASLTVVAAAGAGSSAGTYSYQWRKGTTNLLDGAVIGGVTSATLTFAGATLVDTAGNYNVVVTRTLNGTTTTTTSGNAALRVNIAPTIGTQPANKTVVAGAAAGYKVVASVTGGGTLSYQWRRGTTNLTNGTNVAGATGDTLTLSNAALADTGANINVVVTSTLNGKTASSTSSNVSLFVNVAPTMVTQPKDTTVLTGAATSFTAAAAADNGSSVGTFSYQWRKNGASVATGGTSATYSIVAAAVTDTGAYAVVVTRTLNGTTTSTTSGAGRLFVNAAPIIALQPKDTTAISGANASFTVLATAPGSLSYQWRKGGVSVATGGASPTYALTATTLADTGSYTVEVTSTLNGKATSTTSNMGRLFVNVAPSITTQPAANTPIVVGNPLTLTMVAAPGAGSSAGTLSYQWRKNGVNVASGTGGATASYSIAALAAADSGIYTVVITRTLNGTTTTTTSANAVLTPPVGILPGSFVFRVTGADKPYAFMIPAGVVGVERVTLSISDMWGRTLWVRSVTPSKDGKQTEVSWNGRTAKGMQASAGMYVARIAVRSTAGTTTTYVRKAVSLKP